MLPTLNGAITILQQIVDAVNEVRGTSHHHLTSYFCPHDYTFQSNRHAEDIARVIAWSKKLEYDAIVSPERRFICEGSAALMLDGMKTDVLLFLFSDQLLWSRKLGLIGRLKEKYKVVRGNEHTEMMNNDCTGRKDYAAEGELPRCGRVHHHDC